MSGLEPYALVDRPSLEEPNRDGAQDPSSSGRCGQHGAQSTTPSKDDVGASRPPVTAHEQRVIA
jgi:hypothetical protein